MTPSSAVRIDPTTPRVTHAAAAAALDSACTDWHISRQYLPADWRDTRPTWVIALAYLAVLAGLLAPLAALVWWRI